MRIFIFYLNRFYFFNNDRVDWGLTKQIVENLAESFLNNDFRSFSRNFLPKNGSKILFSSKILIFRIF